MKVQERSSILRSNGDRVNFIKEYLDSVNYFKDYQQKLANNQTASKLNEHYSMSEFLKELENILPGIEKEQINYIQNENIGNCLFCFFISRKGIYPTKPVLKAFFLYFVTYLSEFLSNFKAYTLVFFAFFFYFPKF